GRDPADAADRRRGALADVRAGPFEIDEPLFGRPEDDRLVAAPAVRVLVVKALVFVDEGPRRRGVGDDFLAGLQDLLACVLRNSVREAAGVVDRREDREALPLAGPEIVFSVPGGRVDEASAGVHRDVVRRDDAEGLRLVVDLASGLARQGMFVGEAD